MKITARCLTILLWSAAAMAQPGTTHIALPAQTALPVLFTRTVSAKRAHPGDTVSARTMQAIHLGNGVVIPSGAQVTGHVVEANPFVYDKMPYARQSDSVLTVKFDSLKTSGANLPLNVSVRALADVFATVAAEEPTSSDNDPLATLRLVGGEVLTPSQTEVRNLDGDVVAYNRRHGVYARLIANGRCDASSTEVSMGIYSASACGLYGYTNVSATEFGSLNRPSTLTLSSHRTSPVISKHSTALLEVLPQEQASREQ